MPWLSVVLSIDTFDGAKPRFLNRGKKRRSVSTLSIPRAPVLSEVEGSDRGVEWVDFHSPVFNIQFGLPVLYRPSYFGFLSSANVRSLSL
jgi:hypothetical protein